MIRKGKNKNNKAIVITGVALN